MLVLDNLHWAAPSSLLLLEFMAEELAESYLFVPNRCHHVLHLPLQPGESGSITCVALLSGIGATVRTVSAVWNLVQR